MHIANQRHPIPGSTYFIGLNKLSEKTDNKDLGVLMDKHLDFSSHINEITRKAACRANLILKSFTSRNTHILMKAFFVYVLPILEYCSPIWCPHTVKNIEKIENVQRRFTKRLPGMFDLSYQDRLTKLNLDTLEKRRIKNDLILAYKIIFGISKTSIK